MNEIKIQLLGYLFQNEGIFIAFRKLHQRQDLLGMQINQIEYWTCLPEDSLL